MSPAHVANLTLSEDLVLRVRARVASGEFADESEVIAEALRALSARDDATDRWLRTDVVAAWEEHRTDPSKSRSLDQVRVGLGARFERAVRTAKA